MQTITEPRQVITWQAPNGSTINLAPQQADTLRAAGVWPRNRSGEYCQVSHGLHHGHPTWSGEFIRWCGHYGYSPDDPAAWSDFGQYRQNRQIPDSLAGRHGGEDDAAGVAWWNRLDRQQRRYWLDRAASARPADAWQAFQRAGQA